MVARCKVVLSGTLGESDQARFSVGAHFGNINSGDPVPDTGQALQTWATAIAGAGNAGTLVADNLRNGMGPDGSLNRVDVYYYPDGSNVALFQAGADFNVNGAGTTNMPAQTSIVASLRTGRAGRSYRGRTYWPAIGYGLDDDLSFTSSVPGLVATGIATMWSEVATSSGDPDIELKVYSATLDLLTPVSQISVGSIPDTQRRRRDNLIETYTTVPYSQ